VIAPWEAFAMMCQEWMQQERMWRQWKGATLRRENEIVGIDYQEVHHLGQNTFVWWLMDRRVTGSYWYHCFGRNLLGNAEPAPTDLEKGGCGDY
jgi:hypothetical protein